MTRNDDKEVGLMPRWPIRVKLLAGLSLVVGMILALIGGSTFGLHAFHSSNLKLTDQLRELGASTQLLRAVVRIEVAGGDTAEDRATLETRVLEARQALGGYFEQLKANAGRGNRPDLFDELNLAFQIDEDLTAILAELSPTAGVTPVLAGTRRMLKARAERGDVAPSLSIAERLARLNRDVIRLPEFLHRDFFKVLSSSKGQFESSRFLVWASAVAALGMLCGLLVLVNRWVLYPVRLLHRGVKRVARGMLDDKIELRSGDEMQALAEAFNDMTTQLSATYQDLERQVDERSRQLVRSERLAGVGFLAAGVAHEINNPLASIAFCSEALERRVNDSAESRKPADPKVIEQYLRMIQDEAFRCKRITEKLLDFSRCGEIQRERTDLVALVQSVIEMIQHMGKFRGKSIVFQPRHAVLAHVDAQEIRQVVLNLVVNALDSMAPDGTLRVDIRYNNGQAEMTFDDDGCGMPPEVLENIFEPFYTRRRVGKGTGLGLSISHRIVCQHNGSITASSRGEGKGSTFVVRLPVRPTEPMEAADDHATSGEDSAPVAGEVYAAAQQI